MDKHLHIVCPDVPWPADYGGVIDPYYLLKYLQAAGIQIYLHCFTKNRSPQHELNRYCKEVHYYPRKRFCFPSTTLPYIVQSRSDKKLLFNLQKNNYPILFQGIHCTYFAYCNKLPGRKLLLRPFNVESIYYAQLAALEKNPFKKYYYKRESRLLEDFEKIMTSKLPVLALSRDDQAFFARYTSANDFIPVLLPWQNVIAPPGTGTYCLYQGNLSVNENEKAVEWLLAEVFHQLPYSLIIAGKKPGRNLIALINKHTHATLISNPTEQKLQTLISDAQIILAPSFNHTGIKLKILNALFNGRHCIANTQAVKGSGIEALITLADNAQQMQEVIRKLMPMALETKEKERRSALLLEGYDNKKNADKIIAWIY